MRTIDCEEFGPLKLKQVMAAGGYYTLGYDDRMPGVVAMFFAGQHIDCATVHFARVVELASEDLQMYP